MRFSDNHLRAISQEIPPSSMSEISFQNYSCKVSFKSSRGQWVNTENCWCIHGLMSYRHHRFRKWLTNKDLSLTGPFTNKLQFNTLRPRQNGRHFPEDIFKCIFLNENVKILIKISLKFVPNGPINNIPALVQIMAWRRPGDKPSSKPMMVSLLTHICVIRPQQVNGFMQDCGNCIVNALESP